MTTVEERLASIEATLEQFQEHVQALFAGQDSKSTLALTAAKEAVLKAEAAAEKRFDAVNEFRQTLSDQTATFVTRREAYAWFGMIVAAAGLVAGMLK